MLVHSARQLPLKDVIYLKYTEITFSVPVYVLCPASEQAPVLWNRSGISYVLGKAARLY